MSTEGENQKPSKVGKVIAILTYLFLIVFLFIYGFLSDYYNNSNVAWELNRITLQIMQSVFTLVGFGLLLTKTPHGKWTGLSIALFTVSFNYLLGPLIQQMWVKIFLYFQNQPTLEGSVMAPNAANFWDRHVSDSISTSYLSFRISNICSIAFLVGLTGYGGRINFLILVPLLTLFNFFFYLNFYLNVLLSFSTAVKDHSLRYLDDYGTYLVYLFGGVYGAIVSFMTKSNVEESGNDFYKDSTLNAVLRIFGAFVLFATFIFTGTDIIDLIGLGANYKFNTGPMVIMFSLITAVLGNTIVTIFFNQGRILYNSIVISIISGGIVSGALAGQIQNVGAGCIIGLVTGIICGVYMSAVHPRLNRTGIVDEQGLIGPILIVAFLGSFVVPASVLSQYIIRGQNLFYLNDVPETEWRSARYQLVYFAVTVGIALVTAVIGGILTKKSNSPSNDFTHFKFFISDFGLYERAESSQPQQYGTQQQIRPDVI